MPREFKLPELAESVVEGEVVQWLVEEGGRVEEDQPLIEVMTDKVTVELPSPFAGVLVKQRVAEGEVVPVGRVIAEFDEVEGGDGQAAAEVPARGAPGEAQEAPAADGAGGTAAPAAHAGGERAGADGAGPTARQGPERARDRSEDAAAAPAAAEEDDGSSLSLFTASAHVDDGPLPQVRKPDGGGAVAPAEAAPAAERARGPFGRPLAVPAARRLARELGLDLGAVRGSGPNGRIRLEDVRRHGDGAGAPGPREAPAAPRHRTPAGYEDREERLPLRGLRRATSQQMLASHLHTVRTLHVDEADVGALTALREKLKPRAEARGVKLSYLPFVMKAVAASLQAFPALNASLDEEAGEIVRKRYVHLGMAAATDQGLMVPVIHDVDRLGLLQVAEEVQRLAAGAREGSLQPADVQGGTFSITNVGSLGGGLFSFPIIHAPQAAILGVHSIKRRPVVLQDDRIVPRTMVYLSLSFDHRVVDGAEAAHFTNHLIDLLEAPEALLLEPGASAPPDV